MIGPIAPSDDSNRTVHFSQPNTSRHDLWIGPQVFHIMFDTIEVTENTKSTYHRLLYTLHVLSFDDDISLFSISVCLSGLTILSSCKSLLLSLSSIFAHPVICFFSRKYQKCSLPCPHPIALQPVGGGEYKIVNKSSEGLVTQLSLVSKLLQKVIPKKISAGGESRSKRPRSPDPTQGRRCAHSNCVASWS